MQLLQGFLLARADVGDADQLLLRDTAGVEGAHRQLRARLADGLRGDDADRDARLDQLGVRQVQAVALRADAHAQFAGERAADADPREGLLAVRVPRIVNRLRDLLRDQFALGDDDFAVLAHARRDRRCRPARTGRRCAG